MISSREIREKARKLGVPLSTIQRDYTQNILLDAIFSIKSNMAFKGGTCVKKIYISDYRFSDDLDFTLLSEFNYETLEKLVQDAVVFAKEKSGVDFSEGDILVGENENGFEANVYFQNLVGGKNRIKIKLDITKPENERISAPLEMRKIIHPYSDRVESKINTYSLDEIMAEKIRSLFQRTRPRDLYDIRSLWSEINTSRVKDMLDEKFKIKNLEIDIEDLESRKDYFKNSWESSLRNQLDELPDFSKAFETVLQRVKEWE